MRSKKALPKPGQKVSWRQQLTYVFLSTHFIPCLGTSTFTTLMAIIAGQRSKLIVLIPAVLLGQFTVGWYNDYLDRDNDRLAGRTDKPIAMGYVSTRVIGWFAIPSFIISLTLGFVYGREAGWVYLVAMLSALLYDYRLKRTVFSILTLVTSFGLLPVVVALGTKIPFVPAAWMIFAAATLGATVHFLNVIPDFADDAKTGVKGFVHYFSYAHALLIGASLLILSVVSTLFGTFSHINLLLLVPYAVMLVIAVRFMNFYRKQDLKNAFKVSKLMTLTTLVVLLCATPYMHP